MPGSIFFFEEQREVLLMLMSLPVRLSSGFQGLNVIQLLVIDVQMLFDVVHRKKVL